MLIGAIGDDFSGATELAAVLARAGLRTSQFLGLPQLPADPDDEAVVVTLSTRLLPPGEAVEQALSALAFLRQHGAEQIYFNHASTFASTPRGNIGPILDALLLALEAPRAIVCPAHPEEGRTVYQGHLFIGGRLVSESGMETHPVTPMTDADIRRLLRRQSQLNVGHINHQTVRRGAQALKIALEDAPNRLVIVDALTNEDMQMIAGVAKDHVLVSGSAGLAACLPANFDVDRRRKHPFDGVEGPALVLSGSCSTATRAQVALYARLRPSFPIDPDRLMAGLINPKTVLSFLELNKDRAPMVHSTADPVIAATAQAKHGREALSQRMEQFFAETAQAAVEAGYRRLVVAGGDTAQAVARTLGAVELSVGPEIDPGVPALRVHGDIDLAIAWKTGNFGGRDFFERAQTLLASKI
jgi:uncharacterized protein YgbK (DUF1537 family)